MDITTASLDVTYECNLRCIHCFNESGVLDDCYYDSVLDHRKKEQIILEIAKLNLGSFCFCGGETLIEYNFIIEMIPKIRKISPVTTVSLVSNGILFTDSKAKGLKNAGLGLIQFSLDGFTDESYDFIRGSRGRLNKVKEAIKIAKNNGIEVSIATLPHKKNIQEVPDIIDFCIDQNVKEFRMQPFMPTGRGYEHKDEICLDEDEYIELKEMLNSGKERAIQKKSRLNIQWGDPLDHIFMMQEYKEVPFLSVDAFGQVMLSPYLPFIIWDLKKFSLDEYFSQNISSRVFELPLIQNTLSQITTVNSLSLEEIGLSAEYIERNKVVYPDLIRSFKGVTK